MYSAQFEAILERDNDGTWWYVHVPQEVRAQFKSAEKRGIIAVTVQLGNSVWDGSMLPWADGSAQISVNKRVRTKENLSLGDTLALTVTLR